MKECFGITSYCNNQEKLDLLNSTIEKIKRFNLPIILHAHYPVPVEIQKKVDYYYYSSDNPILDRFNMLWRKVGKYQLELIVYDYGYTVAKGWREIIEHMRDYDRIHIINYDTNVTQELFNLSQTSDKSLFLEHPFRS